MGVVKKFLLGGLDLKSNDLVRDPMRASDLRNVTKTVNGDLDKRNGYEAVETFASLQESCYYKTLDQDVFVKTDGTIWKPYGGSRQSCSIASLNAGGNVIYTEYLSSLYLTTDDGKSPVVKYDGGDAYLAGLPSPNKIYAGTASTISTPGAGNFFRFFYSLKDLNGNITYSPYVQLSSTSANPTITVSTFKTGNPYGKFYNKYLIIPAGNYIIDNSVPGTSNKFAYTSTNYVVGDKILIEGYTTASISITTTSSSGLKFKALTITAIAGGFITIDINDLTDFSFTASSVGAINLDSRLRLLVFTSTTSSFGYINCSVVLAGDISDLVIDNSSNDSALTIPSPLSGAIKFEDLYNEDGQKLRPPLCKYLTSFGDQLVYGNIIGVWDQINNFTQYNNDDLVIYSDFGIADNGENHSANIQRIGESYDGSVTGLKRCNDLLLVTKNNSIFAMDGILEPGGYSLRKIPTNYIGCLSHNSILPTEGGVFFNGNDGIYFTDGVNCSKMSQLLDPFFFGKYPFTLTPDTTKSRSTIDSKNRKYLFYITDNTNHYHIVFDYEFKEWFIWDSLNSSKGLYQKNNKDVYLVSGTKTYKFNTGYSDDGIAISAYYKSNWEDLRSPEIDKKFKYVRLWNLNSSSSAFTMAVQKNWTDTNVYTASCSLAARASVQKGHDQSNFQAIRYVFSNSTLSQGMLITGYEIQYEATQAIDKGN